MTEKIKCYGYVRVSTSTQAEEGESIKTQQEKIKEYCIRKHIELLEIYTDAGISGSIHPTARPEMAKLLFNLEAGKAKGLVTSKIDRISRSMQDFINLVADFNKNNYDLFILDPDIDTTNTIGKFTVRLLANVAELERDMVKDRVKDVIDRKKANNELIGSVPFGKQLKKDISGNKTKILEDNIDEQKTISIIVRERKVITGTIKKNGITRPKYKPYSNICKELIDRERKNKDGAVKWFPAQVKRIYENELTRLNKVKKEEKPIDNQ